MSETIQPAQVGSNDGLGPWPRLVACPLCGAERGYTLSDGSTYRWWFVSCAGCGNELGECHSDRTLKHGADKPGRWEWADEHWNQVGAYAQRLRDAMPNLLPVIQWLGNGCDPKEAAKELRVYQQMISGPSVELSGHQRPARKDENAQK